MSLRQFTSRGRAAFPNVLKNVFPGCPLWLRVAIIQCADSMILYSISRMGLKSSLGSANGGANRRVREHAESCHYSTTCSVEKSNFVCYNKSPEMESFSILSNICLSNMVELYKVGHVGLEGNN